ncbi:MAG: beta-ketoacyl-[acyl-carrier-protein] synthase family protein [Elusimicrobia bacterium]|nr:beta-ketoacyl-[acyl-carrier-protein] synthase family protein [Elusimicrobiota bacterium]
MEKHRVVITGMGVIAPNGIGKANFWNAIKNGESGIKKITRFDVSEYPSKVAGEVQDFLPQHFMDAKQAKHFSRFMQFAMAATRLAVDDSGLNLSSEDPYRTGAFLGTSIGGQEVDEDQFLVFQKKGVNRISPFTVATVNNNMAVSAICAGFGIKGPNMTMCTGCSSALVSLSYGYDLISTGRLNIAITGGSEAPLVPFAFDTFCAANVLTRKNGRPELASRPFDRDRDGYVLSEGACVVIIEEMQHAINRKADIYAEVAGYGITNDSYSVYKMEPTGAEVVETMRQAIGSAGAEPAEIDYINAHGSSSVVSDRRETSAIKTVFGEDAYRIPVSSIKSMIGQPLAATGGFQVTASVMAIREGFIPPTINYENQDPECDLNYVPNRAYRKEIKTVLINSFGVGGNNTSVVVRKCMNIN